MNYDYEQTLFMMQHKLKATTTKTRILPKLVFFPT